MLKQSLPLFETRAMGQGVIEGYASTFGGIDSYGDSVLPGAFKGTLDAGNTPVMLWQHQQDAPIGRWLELREDSRGLYAKGQLNLETTRGREAYAHLRDQDISGLSIGYRIPPGGVESQGDVRLLKAIDLVEISLVSMPADNRARVMAVKSQPPESLRDLQHALQQLGYSRRQAAAIAQKGIAGLNEEAEEMETALAQIRAISKLF